MLFFVLICSQLFAQKIDQKNLLIDRFENTAKAPDYILRMAEQFLREEFISLHQSIFVVDREAYDRIKEERKREKNSVAGTNQQGVTLGAAYLLTGDLLSFKTGHERILIKTEKYTPEPTKANPNPKEEERKIYGIKCTAALDMKIKLVDIETGEIKFEKSLPIANNSTIDDTDELNFIQKGKDLVTLRALKYLPNSVRPDIIFALNPKYYILEVTKGTAPKIKKLLLTGGKKAGFPNFGEIYLNVYEEIEESIDGQKLKREILLGNIKAEDIYDEVSEAIVIKGHEEIGAKIVSKAKIFCRFEKIPVPGDFY